MTAEFAAESVLDAVLVDPDLRVTVDVEFPSGARLTVAVAYPPPADYGAVRHLAALALDDARRAVRAAVDVDVDGAR